MVYRVVGYYGLGKVEAGKRGFQMIEPICGLQFSKAFNSSMSLKQKLQKRAC